MKGLKFKEGAGYVAVHLPRGFRALSWAVVSGGVVENPKTVAVFQVKNSELHPHRSPEHLCQERLREAALGPETITLLTGAYLGRRVWRRSSRAACLVTAGLSNAVRVGDRSKSQGTRRVWGDRVKKQKVGTVNVVMVLDYAMSMGALAEAVSLVVEARTLAFLEARIPSKVSRLPATGTGTDCVVIAAPKAQHRRAVWAGKHTALGSKIGRMTYEAVKEALGNAKRK